LQIQQQQQLQQQQQQQQLIFTEDVSYLEKDVKKRSGP